MMKTTACFIPMLCFFLQACSQPAHPASTQDAGGKPAAPRLVGGSCEGCEAIFEMSEEPSWTDTLPGYYEAGEKMIVEGTIYQSDGRTPAADVLLYVYHTNAGGVYPTKGGEKGWARRHGYIRGWMRSDAQGRYRFVSIRPGSYPDSRNPSHVHATVLEGDRNIYYYIDEFLFADDPFLDAGQRSHLHQRGGEGILAMTRNAAGVWEGRRDIVLGLNIPGYPK